MGIAALIAVVIYPRPVDGLCAAFQSVLLSDLLSDKGEDDGW